MNAIFRKGGNILKNNHTKKFGFSNLALGVGVLSLASSFFWAAPLMAYDYSVSGEANTIFRMRTTTDDKKLFPAYEYLRLNMTGNSSDGSGVSFYLGAWGRADFADKSTANRTDGDLQYAYLTYRAPKNNTAVTIGRQFISEGVTADRVDGLYLRSDFDYGVGASAFFGNSVITEANYKGGTTIYGGRVSHSNAKYYALGLSALRSDYEDDTRFREELGLDLWVRPLARIDVTGRSTYNTLTEGWMEHSYAASYAPLSTLRFGADFSRINFNDYLASVTTSALSLMNPIWRDNERQTAIGTSVGYTGISNLRVSADFRFYSYSQSGDSGYYGAKAAYSFPEELVVGCAIHRMQGDFEKLRYMEYRAFATKKFGHTDLTLDATNVNYDKNINGVSNSYTITGAAGYELNRKLKLGADLEYSKNPDFDREVRALLKATYMFDSKFAAEGGTKSEK